MQDHAPFFHRGDDLVVVGQRLFFAQRLIGKLGIVGAFVPQIVKVLTAEELEKDGIHPLFGAPVYHLEGVGDRGSALDTHPTMPVSWLFDDDGLRHGERVYLGHDLAVWPGPHIADALLFEKGIYAKEHAARVLSRDIERAVLVPKGIAIVPQVGCERILLRQCQLVAPSQPDGIGRVGCTHGGMNAAFDAGETSYIPRQFASGKGQHCRVCWRGETNPSNVSRFHLLPPFHGVLYS
jgi:hypothetical protein